jgi:hypothetical protein
VSSAILYLAIIAIWAGFLVPAWVRRPHAMPEKSSAEASAPEHADSRQAAEHVTETESDVVRHHEPYADQALADRADHSPHPEAYPESYEQSRSPRPSQSRGQMLRARRRILTILVAMTLVTGGFAYLGLVKWWICAPPAGLLVLYVLLLRQIAVADAELARKRGAWEQSQARAYERYTQAQAEREAYPASIAESTAQIIDISGRVTDQPYDQYADAAVRAVGD